MIKKDLSKMTWSDFVDMPLVVHENKNLADDAKTNLVAFKSRSKLGEWVAKNIANRKPSPRKMCARKK